ncbi:MAG: hypothetical protein OQL28_04180 [Sedimenticola sp.]|nr:hypothetical protein [Sedimenticola sp.]
MTKVLLSCLSALLVTGCATVNTPENQRGTIKIETLSEGERLEKVECRLKNSENEWRLYTPQEVMIHNSFSDLQITCFKPNYEPAHVYLKSDVGGGNGLQGNALMTLAGVGAAVSTHVAGWALTGPAFFAVDAVSGAGYRYIPKLSIEMGPPISSKLEDYNKSGQISSYKKSGIRMLLWDSNTEKYLPEDEWKKNQEFFVRRHFDARTNN